MDLQIRTDLAQAHATTVAWLCEPGAMWTGTQKVAFVEQVRSARAAEPHPPWMSPSSQDDFVDARVVPVAAIDAVWRLTNHAATVTQDWLTGILNRNIEPAAYVELVAVVAFTSALDAFADGIGAPYVAVDSPLAGEPTGEVVANAAVSSHWVPTDPDFAGPHIRRAMTVVPGAVRCVAQMARAQYLPGEAIFGDMTWSRGALDRMQVELLATTTSLLNDCFY